MANPTTECGRRAWMGFLPPYPRRSPACASRAHRGSRMAATSTCKAAAQTVCQDSQRRAALVLPGFLSGSASYEGLAAALRAKGFTAEVLPLRTSDWFPTLAGASFRFYTERLDAALCRLYDQHGPIALVGHSAGGWVPRIVLGSEPYEGRVYGRCEMVHTLITLGTPHQSLEQYPFGRAEEKLRGGPGLEAAPPEVRGSSLRFANHFYPRGDSFPGVRVVCVAGDAVRGRPLWGGGGGLRDCGGWGGWGGSFGLPSGSAWGSYAGGSAVSDDSSDEVPAGAEPYQASRWEAYLAYESYKCGCGRGDVDGDGVTPVETALLPGARNLILPSVWHAPRSGPHKPWYGDAGVLEQWAEFLAPCGAAHAQGGSRSAQ